MLKLYAIPLSLYCAKLRILLRYKNLQWQEIQPSGGYGSEEYKQIIPSGNLPALVDDDLVLADSEAIAEYLNEKYPDPPLLPSDIAMRAKARERSRFHDTRLEPELRKLFPYIDEQKRDETIVKKQSEAISTRLHQFSVMLNSDGFILGDHITLGDCGFPITFAWIDALTPIFGLTIEWPSEINDYNNTTAQNPVVNSELTQYRPVLDQWLNSYSSR